MKSRGRSAPGCTPGQVGGGVAAAAPHWGGQAGAAPWSAAGPPRAACAPRWPETRPLKPYINTAHLRDSAARGGKQRKRQATPFRPTPGAKRPPRRRPLACPRLQACRGRPRPPSHPDRHPPSLHPLYSHHPSARPATPGQTSPIAPPHPRQQRVSMLVVRTMTTSPDVYRGRP